MALAGALSLADSVRVQQVFGRKFNRWSLATSLVGLALAVPILYVALQVFGDSSQAWTFVVVHWVYDYALNSSALLIGVCLLAMAMGIPAAWVVTMYSFPARGFFAWGLVLPLALPSYVTAYTYVGIFDYRGPVRTLLNVLGMDSLAFGPGLDIVNIYGLIAVMSFALYPYVYLTARASFAQHSNAVIEVAQSLGRTRSGAFWRVAMPLSRPALVGGVSLVGLETLNEYGAVKYYGLDTFTTGIFSAWYSLGDSDAATRLAACALIGVFVVLSFEQWQRGQRRFAEGGRPKLPLRRQRLSTRKGLVACGICALPFFLGFAIPILQLLSWAALTWRGVIGMDFFILMCNSFAISAVASLLVLGCAVLMVFTARLYPIFAVRSLGRLATLGYSVPGAVIAIGVMLPIAWADSLIDGIATTWLGISTGLLLSNSMGTLQYAYLVRFLAVGYRAVEAGFEGLSIHVEEAARTLGAGPWRTLVKVDVPLVNMALIGAGMLVFIDVLKELPLTLILRPFNFETLATRAFELASDEEVAASANASLIIVAIGAVPALMLNRIMGREGT